MNGFVLNDKNNTLRVYFNSDITKVLIINILGTIELEKPTNKKTSLLISKRHLSSGQYLVKFIKNKKAIDGIKISIRNE